MAARNRIILESWDEDLCNQVLASMATALGGGAFTCKDDDADAPKLLPLAFEEARKFAGRPRRLGRGLVPCLLPGAAVPGADTALKWENPRRRRGWPAKVLQ